MVATSVLELPQMLSLRKADSSDEWKERTRDWIELQQPLRFFFAVSGMSCSQPALIPLLMIELSVRLNALLE
jgi:hypothetical protein